MNKEKKTRKKKTKKAFMEGQETMQKQLIKNTENVLIRMIMLALDLHKTKLKETLLMVLGLRS